MKIKNSEVQHLGQLLFDLSLKGKMSRMRTRFVNILDLHLKEVIAAEQKMLVDQYAKKDEDGNFVVSKEREGDIVLKEETVREYHQEFDTLMSEYMYIDELEANKNMLLSVSEIMLEGDFEVSGEVAEMYDKWCEMFEEVVTTYEKQE